MSATIAAAVIPAPGCAVEIREYPEPALEPDSALLTTELSEVCGTDVHLQAGRLAGVPYPLIPGHVTAGILSKIRGRINDVNGTRINEGDRVTFLDVHRTCNACWHCLVGRATTRCPSRRVYGITYGASDVLAGGWAEAVYLRPGTKVIPLGGTSADAFMSGGCSLPTSLHAVERADIGIGDSVLVLGSGPVGLSAVALARLSGAGLVLCIGAPSLRLDAATAMGADHVLDFTSLPADERAAWVRDKNGGRGADITIEASGAPSAVVDAMRSTRDAGRVVVVGQYTDHGEVLFNPHADLNRKHLDVRGCWGSDYSHFHRAVQVAQTPQLAKAWTTLKLDRFPLERANEALELVATGSIIKALIAPG